MKPKVKTPSDRMVAFISSLYVSQKHYRRGAMIQARDYLTSAQAHGARATPGPAILLSSQQQPVVVSARQLGGYETLSLARVPVAYRNPRHTWSSLGRVHWSVVSPGSDLSSISRRSSSIPFSPRVRGSRSRRFVRTACGNATRVWFWQQHVDANARHPSRRAQEEDEADQGGDGEIQRRVRGVSEAAAGGSDAPRGSEWEFITTLFVLPVQARSQRTSRDGTIFACSVSVLTCARRVSLPRRVDGNVWTGIVETGQNIYCASDRYPQHGRRDP